MLKNEIIVKLNKKQIKILIHNILTNITYDSVFNYLVMDLKPCQKVISEWLLF